MRVFKSHKQLEAALEREPGTRGSFRFLESYAPAGFVCCDCKKVVPFPFKGGGTGYGTDQRDNMFCYPCGALRCAADLVRDGKGVLYLTGNKLTDWTGELKIRVGPVRKGNHNLAGVRYDVWFRYAGRDWHGVQYGDNTQICHVRRLKA